MERRSNLMLSHPWLIGAILCAALISTWVFVLQDVGNAQDLVAAEVAAFDAPTTSSPITLSDDK